MKIRNARLTAKLADTRYKTKIGEIIMDKKVLDRISKNEKRLDTVGDYLNNLEAILAEFRKHKEEYDKLNKYYGSNEWFQDKENFEKGLISNVKAGVLSEDAVWDLNEKFNEIVSEMKEIVDEIIVDF